MSRRYFFGYRPINKMVKMIEWVGIHIRDVSQHGVFRENESGKAIFG